MKDYKKSSNQRRNERIRMRIPSPMPNHLKMDTWVALPVDEENIMRGDLNKPYTIETDLRKQEAEYTNMFLVEHNQNIRYERKKDWIKNKWEKRLNENK
jgi:hypothetical protein